VGDPRRPAVRPWRRCVPDGIVRPAQMIFNLTFFGRPF
jgi:hypothetical protein